MRKCIYSNTHTSNKTSIAEDLGDILVNDPAGGVVVSLKNRRIIKAKRVAEEAKRVAEIARQRGDEAKAADLEADAEALLQWADEQLELEPTNQNQSQTNAANDNKTEAPNEDVLDSDPPDPAEQQSKQHSNERSDKQDNQNNAQNTEADPEQTDSQNTKTDGQQNNDETKDSNKKGGGGDPTGETADLVKISSDSNDETTKSGQDEKATHGKNSTENSSDGKNPENTSDEENPENQSDGKNSENPSNEENPENPENQPDVENPENQSGEENPTENPFDLDPKHATKTTSPAQTDPAKQQDSEKSEFERMKDILKMLRGGEKAGAKAALSDILKAKTPTTESLHETLHISKAIAAMDEDEFNDIINGVLDKIDSVERVKYSGDSKARAEKIKSDLSNTITLRGLNAEDRANLYDPTAAKAAANAREIQKYLDVQRLPDTKQFQLDLYDAIKDQVDKVMFTDQSYGALNRRFANTEVIKKGEVTRYKFEDVRPVIQVYLDCSSSFSEEDVNKERGLLNVLAEFVDSGEIDIQLYYFAIHIHDNYNSARNEGGTSAWNEILTQIEKTSPANVIVVTDHDMESMGQRGGYYNTEGCVWYIWKDSKAPSLPQHLYGDIGLKEYKLE